MTKDQAQDILSTRVQAATALLAEIRKLAIDHNLSVFIPQIDVDAGYDGSSDRPSAWDSSSYADSWESSSYC